MKAKLTAWILATALCGGLVLSGCGRNQPEETEVVAEIIELELDPVEEYETIGDPTSPIEVLMTNEMGRTITGLSVKSPEETEFPDNLMDLNQKFETGQTAEFYYDPEAWKKAAETETVTIVDDTSESEDWDEYDEYGYEEETESESTTEQSALIRLGTSTETYSLEVTLENGSSYIICEFDLDDMDEVTLCFEDGIAYLEYTSLKTNLPVNTKETEAVIQESSTAVQAVIDMIAALPEVTEANMSSAEPGIKTARSAYDALTDEQKEYVSNYYLLEEREYELALLNGEVVEETEESYDDYDYSYDYDDYDDWDYDDGYDDSEDYGGGEDGESYNQNSNGSGEYVGNGDDYNYVGDNPDGNGDENSSGSGDDEEEDEEDEEWDED